MCATAYKLFRQKAGKLYPLYVNATQETPCGIWLDAESGERTVSGKVKSRLGDLAYRPGWHCSNLPYASHIGVKDSAGNIIAQHPDTVWAEVEYATDHDYQREANANGINPRTGRFNPRNAQLSHIPVGGYYRYKTNPRMTGTWIITGSIKVIRVLSAEEVAEICHSYGIEPQPVLTQPILKEV